MMLDDNSVSVPVYAPGDITITQILSSNSKSSHSVTFYLCTEVWGYFDHITTLAYVIKNVLTGSDICQWSSIPENTTPYCVNIDIKAGTLIGYIGGPLSDGSAALDFGTRDTRINPIQYINTERTGVGKQYVVCPYDYYSEGSIKDEFS